MFSPTQARLLARTLFLSTLFMGSSAWAGTIDFDNGASDLSENFAIMDESARVSETAGVSGSSGVRVFNTQNFIYTGESDRISSLRVGAVVTVSAFFKRSGEPIPGSGARLVGFGLTTDDTALNSSGSAGVGTALSGQGNFGFAIKSNGVTEAGVTPMRIQTFECTNGNDPVSNEAFTTFELPDETWIKVEVSFTKEATTGVWQTTITIDNYGPEGETRGENLATGTGITFDGDAATLAYQADSLFATFGAHATLCGALDSFAITIK